MASFQGIAATGSSFGSYNNSGDGNIIVNNNYGPPMQNNAGYWPEDDVVAYCAACNNSFFFRHAIVVNVSNHVNHPSTAALCPGCRVVIGFAPAATQQTAALVSAMSHAQPSHHGVPPMATIKHASTATQHPAAPMPAISHARHNHYVVPPEGSPGDVLTFVFDDAESWENNLPAFMGQIELGTFRIVDGIKQWHVRRRKAKEMRDAQGQPIFSQTTGAELKDLPLLPSHVPEHVSPWRILMWDRKAAVQGVEVTYHDLLDRMRIGTKVTHNALSQRVQRYMPGLGQLGMFDKNRDAFPPKQGMQTIEHLYILQGMLNTWWLPNHMTKRAPWVVVQPSEHPEYEYTNATHTNYQGSSYVIERLYGLSGRVQELADASLFVELKAAEARCAAEKKWDFFTAFGFGKKGKKDKNKHKSEEQKKEERRKKKEEARRRAEFVAEFEHWKSGGGNGTPSIHQFRTALGNAPSHATYGRVMAGDVQLVMSLQGLGSSGH